MLAMRNIARIIGATVLCVLLVHMTFLYVTRGRRLVHLQGEKERHEQATRMLEQEVRELRRKQERFGSEPAYVEQVAREAGFVKPNEVVFRFEPAESSGHAGTH